MYKKDLSYDEFIQNIIDTRGQWNIPEGEYYESHHIIPRCMGGTGRKKTKHENIIWLYPDEHYEAHRLLAKENPTNSKLVIAWYLMSHQRKKIHLLTPEEYSFLKNEQAEINKTRIITEETKHKISEKCKIAWENLSPEKKAKVCRFGEANPNFGRKWSPEVIKKFSEAKTGKNSPVARKIRCIETGLIFYGYREVKVWLINNNQAIKTSDSDRVFRRKISNACLNKKECFNHHWEFI